MEALAPMPREGPCRVEGCVGPERSSGQWNYIPEAYCIDHGLMFRQACMCKKPGCERAVRKQGPVQVPGRKRKGVLAACYPQLTIPMLWKRLSGPLPPFASH